MLLLALVVLVASVTGSPVLADELQDRFDEALTALNADRVNTARRLLSSLVADHPNLHRARLELARANYLARDFAAAKKEAERVLADAEVPSDVRTTILALLAQIRDDQQRFEKRHNWSGDVYAGVMYDSNVNFGVTRDIIEVSGVPFIVNPNSRERSDWAMVGDAGVTHNFNPNRSFAAGERTGSFIWQSQGNIYYRQYADDTEFDLGVLTLRTGPTWIVPGSWRFALGAQVDQIWLGDDELALFTSINPVFARQIGDSAEVTVEYIGTDRDYDRPQDKVAGRDGWLNHGKLSVARYNESRQVVFSAGVGYADFDADKDRFSYSGPEIFGGVAAEMWARGTVYVRAGYRQYDFEGLEPGFTQSRDDKESRLAAGFRHEMADGPLPKWILQGEWAWTDNDASDVPLYDYDRSQISLGISRQFE